MLRLERLEVEGFGPFAEPQVLDFPNRGGVTVIYGENMRGKTSLLNAIRFAFFGTVLGRGARTRRLHTISNRDLAKDGRYGFSVSLTFDYGGVTHELVRECLPTVESPRDDSDYRVDVLLRREQSVLGPQQREVALQQIFPNEISRFFLFDGELLQEYEELLINESEAGRKISEAVERILGVPILKKGRAHLTQLSERADKAAAKEASRHQETQALGNALQQATAQKDAHQHELGRLQKQLAQLNGQRIELEQYLLSVRKYAAVLQERDEASERLGFAGKEEASARTELRGVMSEAWRTLLREPIKSARETAQRDAEEALRSFRMQLREEAVAAAHCGTCDQDIPQPALVRLRETLSGPVGQQVFTTEDISSAMARLRLLSGISNSDVQGELRQLWSKIQTLKFEQVSLKDRIADLNADLADSDPETIRRSKASFSEVAEKVAAVKTAIEEEKRLVEEKDQNVQRLKKRLEASGSTNLTAVQAQAHLLLSAAEVFGAAVEEYKMALRARVEETASDLFLAMTTEREDYAGLTINESYGLTIQHRDGRAEEARSAGAEHVVALALMGALQHNAPLRGPIVMDSPFGRLDEGHTGNVIQALPKMAKQVILLVYEAEVGKARVRNLLGPTLTREFELVKESARRTRIEEIK